MVSIPLKSGHIVIKSDFVALQRTEFVSIPLKSGHIVISKAKDNEDLNYVSIPLKSGHIVIKTSHHM